MFNFSFNAILEPYFLEGQDKLFWHYVFFNAFNMQSPHPLFDCAFYVEQCPHIKDLKINPVWHYLHYGVFTGKNPNPLFDSAWYLEQYPEVAASEVNPLWHYIYEGRWQGKNPNPLFDTSWYLYMNDDVASSGINPLLHYLYCGALEGRSANPLFDTAWYVNKYPEVAASKVNPLWHYLNVGAYSGYDPHPLFDSAWYLEEYPEVAASKVNPLWHYLTFNRSEFYDPYFACVTYQVREIDYHAHNEYLTSVLLNKDSNNENHKVAIIMPTLNRAHIISRAIESVLLQTHKNWELIIVDDGSTDNSKDVIAPYLCDNRIKYFYIESSGVSRARNYGIKKTDADLIAFLDSDNWFDHRFLEVSLAALLKDNLDFVYSGQVRIGDGKPLYLGREFDYRVLLRGNFIDMGSVLFWKNLCAQKGFCDEALTRLVDWDFFLRLTKDTRVKYLPFIGSYYDDSPANDKRISTLMEVGCNQRAIFKKYCFKPRFYEGNLED